MGVKFDSEEQRNALARRLFNLAKEMQQSFDQGHDHRIAVTDAMIGDVLAAAGVVAIADLKESSSG